MAVQDIYFITLFGYREWHNVRELCFTSFKVKCKKIILVFKGLQMKC